MGIVVLALAGVACAVIQRAVGVGYSLVLLPAAITVLPDAQAVPCVLAAGIVLSVGLLLRSGGRPRLDSVTRGLLTAAPFGQLLALLALGGLRGPGLRISAGCMLLAGCASALAQGRVRLQAPGLRAGTAGGFVIRARGGLTGGLRPVVARPAPPRAGPGGDPPAP